MTAFIVLCSYLAEQELRAKSIEKVHKSERLSNPLDIAGECLEDAYRLRSTRKRQDLQRALELADQSYHIFRKFSSDRAVEAGNLLDSIAAMLKSK